jgi:hypothetical protein
VLLTQHPPSEGNKARPTANGIAQPPSLDPLTSTHSHQPPSPTIPSLPHFITASTMRVMAAPPTAELRSPESSMQPSTTGTTCVISSPASTTRPVMRV